MVTSAARLHCVSSRFIVGYRGAPPQTHTHNLCEMIRPVMRTLSLRHCVYVNQREQTTASWNPPRSYTWEALNFTVPFYSTKQMPEKGCPQGATKTQFYLFKPTSSVGAVWRCTYRPCRVCVCVCVSPVFTIFCLCCCVVVFLSALPVALNFQSLGLPMDLNGGRFQDNGRCGYVLKPAALRRSGQGNSASSLQGPRPTQLLLKVRGPPPGRGTR